MMEAAMNPLRVEEAPAAYGSAELTGKEARASLARQLMVLFAHWQLSGDEQLALLGLEPGSRATLARYRKGEPLAASRDLLERAGHLLAIHKNLRLLFPHERELAYAWMRTRNRAFGFARPVDVIAGHGFSGLLMVRAYLDRARGQ
jgi:hypothetical protein